MPEQKARIAALTIMKVQKMMMLPMIIMTACMRGISRDTKMAIMMATMATHRMKISLVIHRMTVSMVIFRMMILIIFMGRTAYIINKEMTAGETV